MMLMGCGDYRRNIVDDVCRSKLSSSGSCNGYDFTQFQTYFDEHRRLKADEQLYELRRRMLTAAGMSAVTASSLSLDSVPTTTSSPHPAAAVNGNSENIYLHHHLHHRRRRHRVLL